MYQNVLYASKKITNNPKSDKKTQNKSPPYPDWVSHLTKKPTLY